jgi:membrane-bound metal-dependent hydrolase YbcI (DUF457 family)
MAKVSRIVYLAASSLFLAGVTLQVFLAGMVVVALQMGWSNHRDLGHSLALPLLVMLISAYLGQLPRSMKWLTWLLFVVYIIQADVLIFMRASLPVASAFHPVLALVDCVLAVMLVYQAWGLVREERQEMKTPPKLEQLDKIGL